MSDEPDRPAADGDPQRPDLSVPISAETESLSAAATSGAAAGPDGSVAAISGGNYFRGLFTKPRRRTLIVLVLVALGLLGVLLLYPWRSPPAEASFRQEVSDRLASLDARVKTLEQSDPKNLNARLGALERAYGELAAKLGAEQSQTDVSASVNDLTQRIGALEAGASSGTPNAAVPNAAASAANLKPLSDRVQAAEDAVRALEAGLRGRVDALESRVGGEVLIRLGTVETSLTERANKADVDAVNARMTKLEQDGGTAAVRRATQALAVSALAEAMRTGAPYKAELSVVEDLSAGAGPSLAPLARHADRGVPTKATLVREFSAASQAALAAPRKESGGFFAWLWRSITSLVTVRNGDAKNTPEAVIARMQAALAKEDLAAAIAEARALDGAPRAALQPWLKRAEMRVEADKALQTLQQTSLRELSQP